MTTHKQRVEKRREYIPFILEYLETHTYLKIKSVVILYIQQKKPELKYNDLEKKQCITKLTLIFAGYFATLTQNGYTTTRANTNRRIYMKTAKLIRGFKNLLKGKKMEVGDYGHIPTSKTKIPRIEWRNFEDLEIFEVFKFNGNPYPKMHFLGITDNPDPHFKTLYNKVTENIKRYEFENFIIKMGGDKLL